MLLFAILEEKYQKIISDLYKKLKPKMEIISLSPDNKGMYFIGTDDSFRGVCYYDFQTKTVDKIFVQEDGVGFINNFSLVSD